MSLILVVDDSAYSRKRARNALQDSNYEIVEAKNGREALDKIAEQRPDCILLDLLMPEMDGFDVLEDMQTQDAVIPVLVVSADIQESTMTRVFELGAKDMLNKAYKDDELQSKVSELLRQD